MHPYTIDGSRVKISGYIMLAAIAISYVANYGLTLFIRHLPFSAGSISISVLMVFSAILWLFNKALWRSPILSIFAGVPDISGTWVGPLDSSYNGDDDEPMRPSFTIHQTWTEIEVIGDFPKSRSESTSASFITDKGRPQLVITYRNYPHDSSADRGPHEGTNTLRYMIDSEGNELLEGEYYTAQQRNNHGTMRLHRPEDTTEE